VKPTWSSTRRAPPCSLLSRTESVTERTITRLADQGSVAIPEPSVTLSLRVACENYGDEFTFSQFLDRGSCSCGTD
jgi:hypothetical protein